MGDFVVVTGIDCDINRISLKVLYSCAIVSTFFCIALISRYLFIRSIEKKVICYISYEPKIMFPWVFLLQLWLQVVFSVIKLVYREKQTVGKNLLITVVAGTLSVLVFLGLVIYFLVVLKFLRGYTTVLTAERNQIITDRLKMLSILSMLIPVACFLSTALLVIGLLYMEYQKIFIRCCLITYGVITLLYGFVTSSALRFVCIELTSHVKSFPQSSDEVRLVLKRLTLAYYMLVVMSSAMGNSYFFFCTTDFLLRKATYLLIWLHISWPPAATILILTVSRITSRVAPERCLHFDSKDYHESYNEKIYPEYPPCTGTVTEEI